MGNLLLFVIPLALAIAVLQLIQLIKSHRKYDSDQLPPGPPGRDHANFLDNDRWNMFKAWNEQYGWHSFFSRLESCLVDNSLQAM